MEGTIAIEKVRESLSDMISDMQYLANKKPINEAELTLAIRHLQDARMRLGVALAIEKGKDPWKS